MKTPSPTPSDRVMGAALTFGGVAALGILFFMALKPSDPSAPMKPVTLVSGDWPPYSGKDLPDQGVATLLVTTALQRIGLAPRVEFMPWLHAEAATEKDESNAGVRGTFPYARTASREQLFYFSDPIMEVEMAVFYNAERSPELAELDGLDSLKDIRIPRIEGYRYPESAESFLLEERNPPKTNEEAFHRLIFESDIDAVIEARMVARSLLRERFPAHADAIRAAPLTFSSPIHLMASKRNPHNLRFIRNFNKALAAMKREGGLAELERAALEKIERQDYVRLEPFNTEDWVLGRVVEEPAKSVALPRGTRAVVEAWGRIYLEPAADKSPTNGFVRVRILNGPMKGRRLLVDGRSIILPFP